MAGVGVGVGGGSVRKHKSDRVIAVITLILMMIGLVVIYAVGPARANYLNAAYGYEVVGQNEYFIHQLVSVLLSVAVFVVAFKLPYERIRSLAKVVLGVGLGLCALLAVLAVAGSSLANCSNGACRWINLGGLASIQPAEVLKLGLVLYLSGLISERKQEGKLGGLEFWLPFLIIFLLSAFFVVFVQKDLGSGISIVAIGVAMVWAAGMPLPRFLIFVGVLGVLGVLAIVSSPHRMERLATYTGSDGGENSYHIDNALMAIGSGGLFGVGVGNSVEATGYLPESINDSVFAVMGETFGLVGLLLVLGCFTWLAMRLATLAEGVVGDDRMLVAVGMFAWVVAHVVINVAAMTGLMPLTGITLPLLSYGGTSMLFIAAGLGICLQLSCYTRREVKDESASGRRGIRRAYHSSRSGSA